MLRIERGYVRPEDELKPEPVQANGQESVEPDREPDGSRGAARAGQRGVITVGAAAAPTPEAEAEDDDGIKPLSERLIVELTAHRTLALRNALANDPGAAFTAVLHALCLGAFYHAPSGSCLEITARSISFGTQAPGLADSASAKAIEAWHQQWAKQLPKTGDGLWDALVAFDGDSQAALFAHCASLSVNAVHEPWNSHSWRLAHADTLARAVNLRTRSLARHRQIAMFVARRMTGRSLPFIGRRTGDRDHTTILHGMRAVQSLIDTSDAGTIAALVQIIERLTP